MYPKLPFLAAVSVYLLFGLSACPPGQTEEIRADFWAGAVGRAGVTNGFSATGWGWKPNSKVEISIWHEPDGPGSARAEWKKILDENVDSDGTFGFKPGAPFYPVYRTICGNPEPGQKILFMAKNPTTGTIRMIQFEFAHIYFTGQPCR